MLPEQQQRIMGYFIEEAKDHLNTIEQGLLNLQATIEDAEKANEVFRAAHSVKGGAAMLGLESIQKTAHRLEDYFKILKESPIQVDQTLETMFLRVSDGLKDLLEQLEGPFGLTPDKAQEIMADVEPVFGQLEARLKSLVKRTEGRSASTKLVKESTAAITPEAVQASFKRDVAALLRQMLAAFKQPDSAETRKTIQDVCAQLLDIGQRFEFAAWCDLIETARLASASLSNDYRALAPVLIKEIKKAQDLVLSGRASEVAVSEAMQSLLPEDILATELAEQEGLGQEPGEDLDEELGLESELADSLSGLNLVSGSVPNDSDKDALGDDDSSSNDDFETLFGNESVEDELDGDEPENGLTEDDLDGGDLFGSSSSSSLDDDDLDGDLDAADEDFEEPIERLSFDLDFDEIPSELSMLNRNVDREEKADESLDALLATVNVTGPDVGTEELNSLADLFDGDLDELDNTLGGHAFISEEMQLHPERIDLSPEDTLNDLLADGAAEDAAKAASVATADDDEMDDLFGGTLTDGEFAITDESDLLNLEDGLDGLSAETSHYDGGLSSGASGGIEDLSEDLWADSKASDEKSGEEADVDVLSSHSGGVISEIPEQANLQDEVGFELPDIVVPDLEISDLADLDLNMPLEELDLDDLNSDDLGLQDLSSDGLGSDDLGSNHLESNSLKADGLLSDGSGLEASRVLGYRHRVSPRELDIEFPTLTGVKLQKAEEDIDSFFVDDFVDELGEESVEASVAGEQLADDPWGELPAESTLTGIKSAGGLDIEQAGSELDELLEDSSGDLNTGFTASEPGASSDDLWNELVSPSEPVGTGSEEFGGVEFESALLNDDDDDSSDDDFDTDGELFVAAKQPDDIFDEVDLLSADQSVPLHEHGAVGDELSDEVLADFETAFGSNSSDELLTRAVDFTTDDVDALEVDVLEVDALEANALDTDDLDVDDLNVGDLNVGDLEVDDLDVDDLLSFDSLDHDIDVFEAEGENTDDSFFEIEENPSVEPAGIDLAGIELDSELAGSGELGGFLTDDELDALEDEPPQLDQTPIQGQSQGLKQTLGAVEDSDSADEEVSDFDDLGFDDLDSLLAEDLPDAPFEEGEETSFFELGDMPTLVGDSSSQTAESGGEDEDFGDLERLLEDGADETTGAASGATALGAGQRRVSQRVAKRSSVRDQNMRVSVNHLDTLSNLVGELVVNRNTLERDQERLRQFLDNLLFQVQQLNDVGQRMRDLYERSLLESSLLSNRRAHSAETMKPADPATVEDHATGQTFDALEMDRFTGFHTLSQEMIELIVRVRESASDIGYTVESSDQVTRQFRQITTQLQEGLNTARMIAFSQAADRLPRAVRDISLKCGKEARLVVEGQDTLIDKMIVEHLYDPLTHLVNNAITHGIETPAARRAAGKPAEGSITVRAFYQGNQTVIYVADDGGGIDTEFVKRKAIEKNLISPAQAKGLSDLDVYELLFHPGFSTRDQADDFAGRGVGMDVVRTSLAEIRGSVTIDSELGKGTSFTIRLPLTLSISKALSCVSNQARIAFPMDGVEDMLDVARDRIVKNDQDQDCVRWRDTLLPFQPVTNLLKFNRTLGRGRVYGGSQDDDVLSVIVLRNANTYIAVQVDQVIGEQEIVIKQLEGPVPKPLGIAGATVLGDGRVMPIADVLELIDIALGRVRREPASLLWAQDAAKSIEESPAKNDPTVLIVDDSITVRELLSMSFNKVGYRVEQARDGQEAWDKLRSGLPCDLVFCDIEMPRMDGLELLSRMQKDNHLKNIPIAMLTSRGADRHRQMAVDLGASGYFTKPYLEEALLDAAQRMLSGETLAKGRGG